MLSSFTKFSAAFKNVHNPQVRSRQIPKTLKVVTKIISQLPIDVPSWEFKNKLK